MTLLPIEAVDQFKAAYQKACIATHKEFSEEEFDIIINSCPSNKHLEKATQALQVAVVCESNMGVSAVLEMFMTKQVKEHLNVDIMAEMPCEKCGIPHPVNTLTDVEGIYTCPTCKERNK